MYLWEFFLSMVLSVIRERGVTGTYKGFAGVFMIILDTDVFR